MDPWVRPGPVPGSRGDRVQRDSVVGRELLEGSLFGCTGVALAVQCGWCHVDVDLHCLVYAVGGVALGWFVG
eukprot:816808-Prymnesium_polylepis.1